MNFLQTGKGLYIEGADFGSNNFYTSLYQMFGCTYVDNGEPAYVGNVSSVTGVSGTIVQDKNYDYLYKDDPDNYIDHIEEDVGTLLFKSQERLGRVILYSGPSNDQRAIHSTFILGALRNGPNTKNELIDIYMDYLLSGVGVEESVDRRYINNLSVSPNPFYHVTNIKFSLAKLSHVRVKIYSIMGQMIRKLIDDELSEGSYNVVWEGNDNHDRKLPSGTYILKIETDGEKIEKGIVLVK